MSEGNTITPTNGLDPFLADISERLNLKGAGPEFFGHCPFHEDQKASLSLNAERKVFCCHGCGAKGTLHQLAVKLGMSFTKRDSRHGKSPNKQIATYPYVDEAGQLLYEVVRYEPKVFRQRRPDGNGMWIWNLKDVRRVLFHLPEVLGAVESGATVWITEGEKDALALVEAGVCATTAAQGASAPWLDNYTETVRGARSVVIVADKDKPGYKRARTVRNALDKAGIPVKVVQAEYGKDAHDHLTAGHGIDDFVEIPTDELDALVGQLGASSGSEKELHVPGIIRANNGEYVASSEGFFRFERDDEGDRYAVEITNADIEIIESIRCCWSKEEETVKYKVAVRCAGKTAQIEVDPVVLTKPAEILSRSGIAEAAIAPGKAAQVAWALHVMSNASQKNVYPHFGWRTVDGRYLFLHGTGALGPSGRDSTVTVDSPLVGYGLPDPLSGNDVKNAVAVSLQAWQVSRYVMTALLGAVFRSLLPVLPPASIHLAGTTGTGKTTLAELALAHFGPNARTMGWTSTANAIENTAWAAANHILIIDDFVAIDDRHRAQLEASAERIMRGAANHQGRARLRPDGSQRPVRPARALVISTGEDTPGQGTQSQRARVLLVDLAPEDAPVGPQANPSRTSALSASQALANSGIMAGGLASYVVMLASWIDTVGIDTVRQQIERAERQQATIWANSSTHARTAPAVAALAVGWEYWINWAESIGALAAAQAEDIRTQVHEDLETLMAAQATHLKAADPADRWRDLLISAFRSGKCHVAWRVPPSVGGSTPGEAWGWRDGEPKGDRIGWLDKDGGYLLPEATHAVISRLGKETGSGWPLSQQQTWKLLRERGWLLRADAGRFTHKITVEGDNPRVIHIPLDLLTDPDKLT